MKKNLKILKKNLKILKKKLENLEKSDFFFKTKCTQNKKLEIIYFLNRFLSTTTTTIPDQYPKPTVEDPLLKLPTTAVKKKISSKKEEEEITLRSSKTINKTSSSKTLVDNPPIKQDHSIKSPFNSILKSSNNDTCENSKVTRYINEALSTIGSEGSSISIQENNSPLQSSNSSSSNSPEMSPTILKPQMSSTEKIKSNHSTMATSPPTSIPLHRSLSSPAPSTVLDNNPPINPQPPISKPGQTLHYSRGYNHWTSSPSSKVRRPPLFGLESPLGIPKHHITSSKVSR